MKLSPTQQGLLLYLTHWTELDRYELRTHKLGDGEFAYIYDKEIFCHDEYRVSIATIRALLRKGVIEKVGTTVQGATRYGVVKETT